MKQAKRRLIVGWRQVPVTKVRVRPTREAPSPNAAAAPSGPPAQRQEPIEDKE